MTESRRQGPTHTIPIPARTGLSNTGLLLPMVSGAAATLRAVRARPSTPLATLLMYDSAPPPPPPPCSSTSSAARQAGLSPPTSARGPLVDGECSCLQGGTNSDWKHACSSRAARCMLWRRLMLHCYIQANQSTHPPGKWSCRWPSRWRCQCPASTARLTRFESQSAALVTQMNQCGGQPAFASGIRSASVQRSTL